MRLAQVAAGEGASAANRLQQPDPQLGQIALGRWRSRGGWLLGNDSGRGRGEARRFILFEYNSPRRSLGARRRRGRGGAPRRITGLSVAQTLELLEQSIDAHRTARFDGFEQGHLNQYLLGCRVPHAHLRLGQNLHDTRKPFGAGHRRLLLERSGFGLGYLQHGQVTFRHLEDEQVAEVVQQIGQQPAQIFAVAGQVVQLAQSLCDFASQHGSGKVERLAPRRQAEHRQHVRLLDLVPAKADKLVKGGFRVAHGPRGPARDRIERRGVYLYLLKSSNLREVFGDERRRDASQVEPLAPRQDCRQHLLGVCRREHELHMLRRLLQGLEQRIERRRREHVDFVDDVDLVSGAGRRVLARLPQLANLLDAVVACAVYFKHV